MGLYFGTTSGELWMSRDEGTRWNCIARHLPEIYAVEAAELRLTHEGADSRARCVSYTGRSWVDADGATLGELLADLDRQYPGIRFRMIDEQDRMRRHVRFFVNGDADLRPAPAPCSRPTRSASSRRSAAADGAA